MRVGLVNFQADSCNRKINSVNFGSDKAIYLCSSLASGFKASREVPTIKDFIGINMEKALKHAARILKKGDFPYWNHSTWPKFLDDTKPDQREMAMKGCIDLVTRCDALVYHGRPKGGMVTEIKKAKSIGMVVLSRSKYLKMSQKSFDTLVEESTHYKRLHKALDPFIA